MLKKKALKYFLLGLMSLVFAHTAYAYWLQTPTFLSRSRLALALFLWVILTFALSAALQRFPIDPKIMRRARWGAIAIILLANLIVAGSLIKIPYTYLFLPSRTVRVQPTRHDQNLQIFAFNTELVRDQSLGNFSSSTGWESTSNRISSVAGYNDDLVWQGKPGEFAEIQFYACEDCGKVKVFWDAVGGQEIDLSNLQGENKVTVRHDYPSLLAHRLVNTLALEGSIILAALLFSALGVHLASTLQLKDNFKRSKIRPPHWVPISLLGALTVVVYGLMIRPVLFNDDWCLMYMLNFDILEPVMVYERRPLHWLLPWIFNQFLQLHLTVYALYITQVVILFATAGFIYLLLNKLLVNKAWFAFLAAVLWLVFPSDYTHLYITMLGIRLAFLLLVVTMLLSVDFMQTGNGYGGIFILASLVLSLLMYEGQLGLAAVWPAILVVLFRRYLSTRKIFGMGIYYFVIAVFVFWKLVLQPEMFADAKLQSLTSNWVEILRRYIHALPTFIAGFRFPYRDMSWFTFGNIVIIATLFLCAAGVYLVSVRLDRSTGSYENPDKSIQTTIAIFLTGVLLWIAGYFPILLNYPPNIYGHLSRVNLFSIPGAVLVLLATMNTIFAGSGLSPKLSVRLTTAGALLLIVLGSLVQVQTQEAYNRSWAENAIFFQKLFTEVPDLKQGTQVILELSGYENSGTIYRPLFSSRWGAWCALRTLYNQADLAVSYSYDRISVPSFPGFNVLTTTMETDTITGIGQADKLLVLDYDRQTHRLGIRNKLENLGEISTSENYAPEDRILPLSDPIPSRRIVE
jgi:hypothetical protein